MKYIVIGGVAAGTKAAAKIMRQDRSAEVCIYTKGKDISYAGCGLPYYVGGSIETRDELIVNTPAKFTGHGDGGHWHRCKRKSGFFCQWGNCGL